RAREPERPAREARLCVERVPSGIRDGEMRHPRLLRRPRRAASQRRCGQRQAKERELEAEVAAVRRLEVAGVVPPLGAEPRMAAVILREAKGPRPERALESVAVALRE